jgi:hypothetical protein
MVIQPSCIKIIGHRVVWYTRSRDYAGAATIRNRVSSILRVGPGRIPRCGATAPRTRDAVVEHDASTLRCSLGLARLSISVRPSVSQGQAEAEAPTFLSDRDRHTRTPDAASLRAPARPAASLLLAAAGG